MRRLVPVLLLLATAGCRQEPPIDNTPIRETKEILYVADNEVPVRERPAADAPQLVMLHRGETVSIVGEQNGWKEIKLAPDRFGWAEASGLSSSSQETEISGGSATVQFVRPPAAVYRQNAPKGEIVFEADVSVDGTVTGIRTISNTTGSRELEMLNQAALQRAVFRPMIVKGTRKPFIYMYRVEY